MPESKERLMERMPLMSYVNSRKAGQNRLVTAGVVAVIQTGLVLALVNGFKVDFFADPPKPPLSGTQIALPPPPPPEPTTEPQPRIDPKTPIDVPDVPRPLPPEPDVYTVPREPSVPLGGLTTGTDVKPYVPADPPSPQPSFAPKSARVKNDPATWATTNDYPSRDLREGNQGRVSFSLGIGVNGRVESCRITASSGFPGLDAATCANVGKRARFEAAMDDTGAKVPGTYSGTIRWVIPRD